MNALRLSDFLSVPMRVLWPVGHYAQELEDPAAFFAPEFVEQYVELDGTTIARSLRRTSEIGELEDEAAMRACLADERHILVENVKGPLALPGETEEDARKGFIEAARRVLPAQALAGPLEKFEALGRGGALIGLHIRRGDIIEDGRWSRRYWPTKYVPDAYYDAMIASKPHARHVVFSDTPATMDRFAEVHGVPSAARVMGLDNLTDAQRDFAELLALSRCVRVLAGSDSAFSTAAAMIGGTEKLALPDDMPEIVRADAEARLLDQVRRGPEAFLNVHDFGQSAHRCVDMLRAAGEEAEAQAILMDAASRGLEVPHLLRDLLGETVARGDDLTALRIAAADLSARPLKAWQMGKPSAIRLHMRNQVVACGAEAGLGDTLSAARRLAMLGLSQYTHGPLDVFSRVLGADLVGADPAIPPTTPIPFAEKQIHPRGVSSLIAIARSFAERFCDGLAPLNWQTPYLLDWDMLTFAGRREYLPKPLQHIADFGRRHPDPMVRSLSGVALLQLGQKKRAQRRLTDLPPLPKTATDLHRALIAKRLGQVALGNGRPAQADAFFREAVDLSDHPAFATYRAKVLMGIGRHDEGMQVINSLEKAPPFVQWILFKNAPKLTGEDDGPRIAARDAFLGAFAIEAPEAAQARAAE